MKKYWVEETYLEEYNEEKKEKTNQKELLLTTNLRNLMKSREAGPSSPC